MEGKARGMPGNRRIARRRAALGVLSTGSVLSQSLLAGVVFGALFVSPALAAGYPPVPFVYQNLFRAASALMAEMKTADKKGCLTDTEKAAFANRVGRLEIEIDLQLTRPDAGEFFSGYPARPVSHSSAPPSAAAGGDNVLPMSGAALGSSPRYNLNDTKTALDQELSALDAMPDCSDVPHVDPGPVDEYMSVPPTQAPGFGFGGFGFGFGGGGFGGDDPRRGQDFNRGRTDQRR